MTDLPILVLGATGQQGGSVAAALLDAGRPVRALVRDPSSDKAQALATRGVELVRGDLADRASLDTAMTGAIGVFSVQPASPTGTLSDGEETRFGIAVADAAVDAGVGHLVYSSSGAVGDAPSGVGHFDSKLAVERHVRTLPIGWTIMRPVAFMDMLVMPGFGLDNDRFTFFAKPEQPMQLIAVEDIGRLVAPVFANPARHVGQTIEIAGDQLTGGEIGTTFSKAAGRPIAYARFPDKVLAGNPFLAKLTALLDAGPLAGHANIAALRSIEPRLLTFDAWLAGPGRDRFEAALQIQGSWQYDRND